MPRRGSATVARLLILVVLATLVVPGLLYQINGRNDELIPRDDTPFLRIMPLGASITFGYKSTGENGYREALRQQLRFAGWEVDMVGSLTIGTMKDNDNEGHYGYRIDQVQEVMKPSLDLQPNLILLNAGTNDALQGYNLDTAGERIDAFLTQLFDAIPGTTVILSTLIPNAEQPDNIDTINPQYRQVAATRRANGYRVVLAEMNDFIKASQLVDGIHPTDYGYKEMASVWWAAIQEAHNEGMLQAPNGGTLTPGADDSLVDPKLPAYTAPAQPVVSTVTTSETGAGFQGPRPCSAALLMALPAAPILLS